jgi:sigma-B regulation protein RsbU (phosphoserine phosphatase)
MRASVSPRCLLLAALATVFATTAILYTAISVYHYSQVPAFEIQLGVDYGYDYTARAVVIKNVVPGSAAERASLRAADAVVAVNGHPLDTLNPFYDAIVRGRPGDSVVFTVRRAGHAAPITLRATLARLPRLPAPQPLAQRIARTVTDFYPIPAMLVGLIVLVLRLEDRNAWLLAALFAGLATGRLAELEGLIHPALRGFALGYFVLFNGIWPAIFYTFLSTFPAPSALDRRVPWLKAVLLVGAGLVWVPSAVWCVLAGSAQPVTRALLAIGERPYTAAVAGYSYVAIVLGFVSVGLNCRRRVAAETRRKARLVAWSFVIGYVPWLILQTVAVSLGKNVLAFPFWVLIPVVLLLMLLPVMFAYTVVKHRVLEFSVLVRRSARYVLVQRGFVLATAALSISVTALFAIYSAKLLPRLTDAALPVGIAGGALFGLVAVRTGGALARRVARRIDRAFFRQAYDAGRILEGLAQKVRMTTSRGELASLLETEIVDAIHPRGVAVYMKTRGGALAIASGPGALPATLAADLPLVDVLERSGQPWTVPPEDPVAAALVAPLAALEPECLVPIVGHRAEVTGLLALGPRLSDEPYSRDDRKLLASVAGQAGLALESLTLAEEMADRLDVERRSAQELAIAAEVQRRLLPQKIVPMTTLEYAGMCRQAREVGGDYYDFLDLGPGQLGLVLADVSGKGLYAALLMANLQASLRSLSARAAGDVVQALETLNRSFCESTAGNHFATLFLALYDDVTRRVRYANCGHCSPFLLRANGDVERLPVTAGAIGMFEPWHCAVRDFQLGPGDLLAVFSDGVTEAMNAGGEEFGERGLLSALEGHRQATPAAVLDGIIAAVHAFSGGEQHDDLTLVVARGRERFAAS